MARHSRKWSTATHGVAALVAGAGLVTVAPDAQAASTGACTAGSPISPIDAPGTKCTIDIDGGGADLAIVVEEITQSTGLGTPPGNLKYGRTRIYGYSALGAKTYIMGTRVTATFSGVEGGGGGPVSFSRSRNDANVLDFAYQIDGSRTFFDSVVLDTKASSQNASFITPTEWDGVSPPATRYLGIALHESGTSTPNYAWIKILKGSVAVVSTSFNATPGAAICAGINNACPTVDVPEPSSLALMAVGAAAVLGLRRRLRNADPE